MKQKISAELKLRLKNVLLNNFDLQIVRVTQENPENLKAFFKKIAPITTNHELIGDMEITGEVLVTLDGNSNINLPPGSKLVINFPGGFLIIVGSSFTIS